MRGWWVTPAGRPYDEPETLVSGLLTEAVPEVLADYRAWVDATYSASDIEEMAYQTRETRTVIGLLYARYIDSLRGPRRPVEGIDYTMGGVTVARWEVDG